MDSRPLASTPVMKVIAAIRRAVQERFFGTLTITFQEGHPTHVKQETTRTIQDKDLPDAQ